MIWPPRVCLKAGRGGVVAMVLWEADLWLAMWKGFRSPGSHPILAPVDWKTPGLQRQYRVAKVSIIRSIFWASPGSRKLHRNCLGEEQGHGQRGWWGRSGGPWTRCSASTLLVSLAWKWVSLHLPSRFMVGSKGFVLTNMQKVSKKWPPFFQNMGVRVRSPLPI